MSLNFAQVRCSSHGKCFYDVMRYFESGKTQSFQTCICDSGYTDLDEFQYVKCCYKRKSQFIAFLLEFLIGFGLGHFYIGSIKIGFLKLFGALTFCCSFCTIACCFCYRDEYKRQNLSEDIRNVSLHVNNANNDVKFLSDNQPLKIKIFNILMMVSIYSYIGWQIADTVMFGLNMFPDGQGIELQPW